MKLLWRLAGMFIARASAAALCATGRSSNDKLELCRKLGHSMVTWRPTAGKVNMASEPEWHPNKAVSLVGTVAFSAICWVIPLGIIFGR